MTRKIVSFGCAFAAILMLKGMFAPTASRPVDTLMFSAAATSASIEPHAFMRAAPRDLPAESWSGH